VGTAVTITSKEVIVGAALLLSCASGSRRSGAPVNSTVLPTRGVEALSSKLRDTRKGEEPALTGDAIDAPALLTLHDAAAAAPRADHGDSTQATTSTSRDARERSIGVSSLLRSTLGRMVDVRTAQRR